MLSYEINEFGKRLGLPSLELDENDRVGLEFAGVGSISLEVQKREFGAELLLVFAKALQADEMKKFATLLERVNWRTNLPFALTVACFRNQLILTARFSEEAVSAVVLENALRMMLDELARA